MDARKVKPLPFRFPEQPVVEDVEVCCCLLDAVNFWVNKMWQEVCCLEPPM